MQLLDRTHVVVPTTNKRNTPCPPLGMTPFTTIQQTLRIRKDFAARHCSADLSCDVTLLLLWWNENRGWGRNIPGLAISTPTTNTTTASPEVKTVRDSFVDPAERFFITNYLSPRPALTHSAEACCYQITQTTEISSKANPEPPTFTRLLIPNRTTISFPMLAWRLGLFVIQERDTTEMVAANQREPSFTTTSMNFAFHPRPLHKVWQKSTWTDEFPLPPHPKSPVGHLLQLPIPAVPNSSI